MATYTDLSTAIMDISKNKYIQTASSVSLLSRINQAVAEIAGGIRMPNGEMSPPLPALFKSDTVATTAYPYVTMPATYQRALIYVVDPNGLQIKPPTGGNYYSWTLFMDRVIKKDLSSVGEVDLVCVKGSVLYYQSIPSVSVNLSVVFYRKPVAMAGGGTETPDGIPEHLQMRLIKHRVGFQLANEMVDGTERMIQYHEAEFYKAMQDLVDHIGYHDAGPEYYGSGSDFVDLGICD